MPRILQLQRREFEVADERPVRGPGVNALRHDTRKAIDLSAAQRLRIIDGLADAILELGNAIRMAGDAALAGVPIARGQVEENLGETVGVSAAPAMSSFAMA